MNYLSVYNSICERGQNPQRVKFLKDSNTYTEVHHIIPRSLGGTNNKSNLTTLTAREHFICHWLLCKIHKDDITSYIRMCFAFHQMCGSSFSNSQRKVNSHSFEYGRKRRSDALKKMWQLYKENKLPEDLKKLCDANNDRLRRQGRDEELRKANSKQMKERWKSYYDGTLDPKIKQAMDDRIADFVEFAKRPKSEEFKKMIGDNSRGKAPFYNTITKETRMLEVSNREQWEKEGWVTLSSINKTLKLRNKKTKETKTFSYEEGMNVLSSIDDWEYFTNGYASYKNIVTGETTLLSKDDPRRKDGNWISTAKGFTVRLNKETGETKRFSINENFDESIWIPVHSGKRKYKNKMTGEVAILLVLDERLKTGEWELATKSGKNRNVLWFNFITRESENDVFTNSNNYDEIDGWLMISSENTKIVNKKTLEIKNFDLELVKKDSNWIPYKPKIVKYLLDSEGNVKIVRRDETYNKKEFKSITDIRVLKRRHK